MSPSLVITRLLIPKSIPMALSVGGNGWIVGSSNLIEICQRPEGCNLTVTVLGSQLSGIYLYLFDGQDKYQKAVTQAQ